jgi:sulfur-oxidizing protein SoxA
LASVLALLALLAVTAFSFAQDGTIESYQVEDRKSGYLFLSDGTRALQDDEFQNPGMFTIDRGQELWTRTEGASGKSCASCHGDASQSMRGVATHYPKYDATRGGLINLELRINDERAKRMQIAPLTYESDDLLALTAYISAQSRGMPMDVDIGGNAQPYFEAGREFYFQRHGQLDLSCNQCHDAEVGKRLRGDLISQGQVNGFPLYRVAWRVMTSRHRQFRWCNTSVRAEPFEYGSDEYLALELYVAWRGRGLPIETPAVRR